MVCRIEAHIGGSSQLEGQLTCAHEEAERQCAKVENLRRRYLEAIENFKDLLLNDCGEWFIPQSDTEKLWRNALSIEADIGR